LEYAAGIDWMTRTLSFRDDLYDRLGRYDLPAAPVLSVGARWFPGAHVSSGWLSGLGVSGSFQGAFGVTTSLPSSGVGREPSTLSTTVDQFTIGLVYRVRFLERISVEAALDYGEARFRVDPDGPSRPGSAGAVIPSVHYHFVRPGLAIGVRLPVGFGLRGALGWRGIVDAGPLTNDEWFPRSSATGLDLSIGLSWRFDRWFELRVHAEHVRYLTDVSPEPGDALVVGGMADEWTRAGLELAVIIPGVP